ncbi:hypothetical protein HAX54_036143, partial [Datura stramonium]|nr:hypothetical protein [Datura stramonium]
GVIDLATKTEKDTPAFKKPKLTSGPSDPPSTEMSRDAPISPMANRQVSLQARSEFLSKHSRTEFLYLRLDSRL